MIEHALGRLLVTVKTDGSGFPQVNKKGKRWMVIEGTHEGFQLRRARIELPLDNAGLDEETQLDLLICYLFVNERRPVSELARIGLDHERTVQALLEQGMVWDRRQNLERANSSRERSPTCRLNPRAAGY